MNNSNGSFEHKRIASLVMKYLRDTLTIPEAEELEQWKQESTANREQFNRLVTPDYIRQEVTGLSNADDAIRQRLAGAGIQLPATAAGAPRVVHLRQWVAAASILIAAATGMWLWSNRRPQPGNGQQAAVTLPVSIPPGKSGAILTLADGSQLVLDSMGNGVISTQTGVTLVLKDSALTYNPAGTTGGTAGYNTMTTPNGRQFQVLLPDGSKVWLNAASSLRYPTAFTGKARKVEVTGEAYFEIAPKAGMPFRINVNNKAEVEVLGTGFNVNAYENESLIRTTLMHGAIKVKKEGQSALLKPGQQASIAAAPGSRMHVETVNTDQVAAWRNGLFNFQDAPLQEVMKQLERWYNIKVVYEKKIPDIKFGGELSRNITLEGLLRTLEASEVHFRMEDNQTLVISP